MFLASLLTCALIYPLLLAQPVDPPPSSPDASPNTQPHPNQVGQIPHWRYYEVEEELGDRKEQRLRLLEKERQLNSNLPKRLQPEHVGSQAFYALRAAGSAVVHQYPLTFLKKFRRCMIKKSISEDGWDEPTAIENVDKHLDGIRIDYVTEEILADKVAKCIGPARSYTRTVKEEIDEMSANSPNAMSFAGERVKGAKGQGFRSENLLKAGQDNIARLTDGVSKYVKNVDWGRMVNQFSKGAAAWIGSMMKPSPGMKRRPALKPV
ncbi:MAG: hypothetical protein M1823_004016 [Watsoniomyces obsoletus]|nr:MAG: hypothetical protein M1823_004016 [Watsoniomyces obsoletus]